MGPKQRISLQICDLEKEIARYEQEKSPLSVKNIALLESNTREQSASGLWHNEHNKGITSSNFGTVIYHKVTSKTAPLVVQSCNK